MNILISFLVGVFVGAGCILFYKWRQKKKHDIIVKTNTKHKKQELRNEIKKSANPIVTSNDDDGIMSAIGSKRINKT
jgi:hypothetical protein